VEDTHQTGATQEALLTPPASYTFSIQVPSGTSISEFPVLSSWGLTIGNGASIQSDSLVANAVNTGDGPTTIAAARPGPVTSKSTVSVLTGAYVDGRVVSANDVIVLPGATVTQDVVRHMDLGTFTNVTFTADYTPAIATDVAAVGGQHLALPPGRYGNVVVFTGGDLQLSAGTYRFNTLTVNLGASVTLRNPSGTTQVYVRDNVVYAGVINGDSAEKRLLVGYSGCLPITLATPFRGTFVAPLTPNLLLSGGLLGPQTGSFIGKQVTLDTLVRVIYAPYDWTNVLPPPAPVALGPAPIELKADMGGDGTSSVGTATSATPVNFSLPPYLRVTAGNAGNGTTLLTYTDSTNQQVTCTYQGGSSTLTPDKKGDDITDWARGLRYNFVSCSNGLHAGDAAQGTNFGLQIVSGDPMGVLLRVETFLGAGCSEPLEDSVDPVTSAQLASTFDWSTTQAVPETDPQGHPSLRYAMFYLESRWQVQALNSMGVNWDPIGLFNTQLQKYEGKCGPMQFEGDGHGVFVHAIIPGTLYNYIRNVALQTLGAADSTQRMPFRIVILPDRPDVGLPGVWNTDGSLSWDVLKQAQWSPTRGRGGPFGKQKACFLGLCHVTHVVEQAVDWVGNEAKDAGEAILHGVVGAGKATLNAVGTIGDTVIETGAKLVDTAWNEVTKFFGTVDRLLAGSVNVTMNFSVMNADPAFDDSAPMVRGWGPTAGAKLLPTGASVWVKQWVTAHIGVNLGFVKVNASFGILPSNFEASLPDSGTVSLKVAKNALLRGAGMCIDLENDAGKVDSFVLANEVCDFTGENFNGFANDTTSDVKSSDWQLSALTQATDGAKYMRDVVGHDPYQVEIGTGLAANILTKAIGNDSAPFTPCLDFPSLQSGLATILGEIGVDAVLPGVAQLVDEQVKRDMFISSADTPSARDARISRGVFTHEYGHFSQCSMMYARDSNSLEVLLGRLGEGKADSRSDTLALFLESYADFIASQVSGGTNYLKRSVGGFTDPGSNNMSFCVPSGGSCVETNFKGNNDSDSSQPFNDELARLLTTYVDVFDGTGRFRSNFPDGGGLWTRAKSTTPLTLSSSEYLPVGDVDDERVSLGGADIERWMDHYVANPGGGYQPALIRTMQDEHVPWCDICDILSLHDKSAPAGGSQSTADRSARQQYCLSHYNDIGTPPDPDGRIDAQNCTACPSGQVAPDGVCQSCPPNTFPVGNGCSSPCPPLTVVSDDKTGCVPCSSKAIWVDGSPPFCEPCGFDRGATASNECAPCMADAVVTLDATSCSNFATFRTSDVPASGDNCPTQFWVEVRGVPEWAAAGGNLEVSAAPDPEPADANSCQNTSVDLQTLSPSGTDRWDFFVPYNPLGTPGDWAPCSGDLLCVHPDCDYSADAFSRDASALASGPVAYRFVSARNPLGNITPNKTIDLRATTSAGHCATR
jgi:hypothetical protein